jgi:hypothetical protein
LEVRVEGVADVVLDRTGRADQHQAAAVPCQAADNGNTEQERGVLDEFCVCHTRGQIIDRAFQDPGATEGDDVGEHDTGQPQSEPSAIADDERQQLSCGVVNDAGDPRKC